MSLFQKLTRSHKVLLPLAGLESRNLPIRQYLNVEQRKEVSEAAGMEAVAIGESRKNLVVGVARWSSEGMDVVAVEQPALVDAPRVQADEIRVGGMCEIVL